MIPLTLQYAPELDMPQKPRNGLRALSLFSGGGGLDLGFDLAGYEHVASYDVLDFAGRTLQANRPNWTVHSGEAGDVTLVDWTTLRGKVDVIHGGPPCQPFSIAGRRAGQQDGRDMFPQFVRAVQEIQPRAFLAENVLGFLSKKFANYRESIIRQLSEQYSICSFTMSAADFGVPQDRRRAFMVGIRRDQCATFNPELMKRFDRRRGVIESLGLKSNRKDELAPTLRCTLTGPRQTTSIANSTASVEKWQKLGIWPHGVSANRTFAASFAAKDGLYRLCVEECQSLQGFPQSWAFIGAVYQRLGLIGNSVCPPLAYALANSIQDQAFKDSATRRLSSSA
jgi:DNA (cytosine-5)-methyltransferase 1